MARGHPLMDSHKDPHPFVSSHHEGTKITKRYLHVDGATRLLLHHGRQRSTTTKPTIAGTSVHEASILCDLRAFVVRSILPMNGDESRTPRHVVPHPSSLPSHIVRMILLPFIDIPLQHADAGGGG